MKDQPAAVALVAPALPSLVAAGFLAAGLVSAQEPASTPEEAFFERVDVNVVTVDVVVTDKQGRAVTGLGRDDFEIL